jgi:hypothetical protein
MPITYNTLLYEIALILIISFCFWKPNFPKKALTKIGIQSLNIKAIFLGLY